MSSMSILTPSEMYDGDQFFTDSNVQRNRASAGCDINMSLNSEPGVITGWGLNYTKVLTRWGEVFIPWQVTGSSHGLLSGLYDMIAVGVPVTVDARRVLDKAYSWTGTNLSVHIGLNRPDQVNEHHFIYNTKNYNNPNTTTSWSQWCGSSDKEVANFIGKGGWSLRQFLEENKMDNTFIQFTDEPDGEKMIHISAPKMKASHLSFLLNERLIM